LEPCSAVGGCLQGVALHRLCATCAVGALMVASVMRDVRRVCDVMSVFVCVCVCMRACVRAWIQRYDEAETAPVASCLGTWQGRPQGLSMMTYLSHWCSRRLLQSTAHAGKRWGCGKNLSQLSSSRTVCAFRRVHGSCSDLRWSAAPSEMISLASAKESPGWAAITALSASLVPTCTTTGARGAPASPPASSPRALSPSGSARLRTDGHRFRADARRSLRTLVCGASHAAGGAWALACLVAASPLAAPHGAHTAAISIDSASKGAAMPLPPTATTMRTGGGSHPLPHQPSSWPPQS